MVNKQPGVSTHDDVRKDETDRNGVSSLSKPKKLGDSQDSASTLDTEVMSPDSRSSTESSVRKQTSVPPQLLTLSLVYYSSDEAYVLKYSPALSSASASASTAKDSKFQSHSCLRKPGSPSRRAALLSSRQPRGEIEILLPNHQDEPIVRKTYVVFDETVHVKRLRPVQDLADKYSDLWFTGEEYDMIKQRIDRLVYRVEKERTKGRKYCMRGLERLLSSTTTGRRSIDAYQVGLDVVLNEQQAQFNIDEYDDELISDKYQTVSAESKREALDLAAMDEKQARKYYYCAYGAKKEQP